MQKHVDGGLRLIATVLGVGLVLAVWWWFPGIIPNILDANLYLIKLACGLIPGSY